MSVESKSAQWWAPGVRASHRVWATVLQCRTQVREARFASARGV